MIITEFYEGQGLGNQLWVYAACRSIADHLNYPFAILGQNKFKGSYFIDIDFGQHEVFGTVNRKTEVRFSHESIQCVYYERMFYDPDLKYIAVDFDESVTSLSPYTRIEGLFQSERYFFDKFTLPKKYIKVKETYLNKMVISNDCCVLNIRGGEYKSHKNLILPKSYWQNAIHNVRNLFGIQKFIVVTDDRRYAAALFPELSVLQGGIAECYVALYHARYLILSNSSFSYFPVKTGGDKLFVIAPMHWARFGNQYSRWASPANLYESWMWQDIHGKLYSYTDCLQEQADTTTHYREKYYISTAPSVVTKPSIKGYIPVGLRKSIKKGLSVLFPRYIG